jgi:hypothetical protein
VTDLIIQATLNGCYSNWVKCKLAVSGTDEVTGNVVHRSDWYVKSVGPFDWGHPDVLKVTLKYNYIYIYIYISITAGPYLAVVTCSVM